MSEKSKIELATHTSSPRRRTRARLTEATARQQRVVHANALIQAIAAHGRRFFYCVQQDRSARIEVDQRGRVWWIDDYTGKRIFTHPTPAGNRWRGFSQGGTLRHLAEMMREYITTGTPIARGYIAPSMSYGDLWGYGEAGTVAVRDAAFALPIMAPPQDSS